MKWIQIIIFLGGLCLLQTQGFAQEFNIQSDTLLWKASNYTDAVTDTTAANSSEFITYSTSQLKWTQQSQAGTTVFEFTVQSVEGDLSSDGYIIFHTTRKNKNQTFRFEHIGTSFKVTLSYDASIEKTFIFSISTVSKITN